MFDPWFSPLRRLFRVLVTVIVCFLMLRCGSTQSTRKGIHAQDVIIQVRDAQNVPLPDAPIELGWLYESGDETSAGGAKTDMNGEYRFQTGSTAFLSNPPVLSLQVWVRVAGYPPTRQILQLTQQTTRITFRLAHE